MMNLLLRKADEMGINFGLRLLAMSLSLALLFLVTYYFLVVNRSTNPVLPTQEDALKTLDAEKRKADAALISRIKSAISQTKRLHGYGIGVECREGQVTLTGEVPTEIDKDLAANLARETSGVKNVTNQIRIAPEATPQPGETTKQDLAINVDDLELQANLHERLQAVSELKTQRIAIKVQNRAVTLTGSVATEAQKDRVEQILRNYPKVTAINNQLRIGSTALPASPPTTASSPTPAPSPKPSAATSEQDRSLLQTITAALNANRADFSEVNAIKVTVQNGDVTLSGTTPTRAERALAERLAKEVAGVKSLKNLIAVGAK